MEPEGNALGDEYEGSGDGASTPVPRGSDNGLDLNHRRVRSPEDWSRPNQQMGFIVNPIHAPACVGNQPPSSLPMSASAYASAFPNQSNMQCKSR